MIMEPARDGFYNLGCRYFNLPLTARCWQQNVRASRIALETLLPRHGTGEDGHRGISCPHFPCLALPFSPCFRSSAVTGADGPALGGPWVGTQRHLLELLSGGRAGSGHGVALCARKRRRRPLAQVRSFG
ncbi:gap junction alpha-9 protein isoform X2 [Pyrgilauda ruficollis]|uniref:gap junction alpha-9 protein isoform X2 n=1 Tax=Pyrgilauda ruficollis TaxID=221976 RepID=UPI001B86018F|nr:gap junction alpha-9 protein isoform X2 [Pyrgilauda ruficollis]